MDSPKMVESEDADLLLAVAESKAAYRSALAAGRLRAAIGMASNLWTLTEDRFWLRRAADLEDRLAREEKP